MSARLRAVLFLALAVVLAHSPVFAQEARVALTRDTVNVGDIVGVAFDVRVPAGYELVTADTLELSGDLENAAPRRIRIDTLQEGGLRYLITYPIAAWRPGDYPLPKLTATVQTGGQQLTIEAAAPPLTVISVLPTDTANVQPKPPRDVWGANRLWWPLLLLALLALLLIGALIWWWRRRKKKEPEAPVEVVPLITPREWAQKEIDRIVAARYIERAEFREFYIDLTTVMRTYLNKLDSTWSTDLTTSELAGRLGPIAPAAVPLLAVLNRADLVKFARHRPIGSESHGDVDTLRQWVATFDKPLPVLAEAA